MQQNVFGIDPAMHAAALDSVVMACEQRVRSVQALAEEKLKTANVFIESLKSSAAADVSALREENEHMRSLARRICGKDE